MLLDALCTMSPACLLTYLPIWLSIYLPNYPPHTYLTTYLDYLHIIIHLWRLQGRFRSWHTDCSFLPLPSPILKSNKNEKNSQFETIPFVSSLCVQDYKKNYTRKFYPHSYLPSFFFLHWKSEENAQEMLSSTSQRILFYFYEKLINFVIRS